MKIRVFVGLTEGGLEKRVNKFLESNNIKVIETQFAGGFGFIAIMIRYENVNT
jgi:hypothetical protein